MTDPRDRIVQPPTVRPAVAKRDRDYLPLTVAIRCDAQQVNDAGSLRVPTQPSFATPWFWR